ncbi:sulfotransferase [Paraglaciecola sp.]|uniref:sulfotransferase family protein n=1 Tax=Paraglaciecola sp. TaxID=1920173 RepID=UPI003267250C
MTSKIKQQVIDIFLKFLGREEIQNELREQINQASCILPVIENTQSPYTPDTISELSHPSLRDDIVFITSRFRSGSTLLWNLFRQTQDCTSYYEPFNERQWFNPELRGNNVDNTHRGVADYSAEYNNLTGLSKLYNENWIRQQLLMTESSWNPNMKAYIESLIDAATGRPILQFNRIDFRLPWLKKHFPNAKIIHLYRHPRDQWCSFLTNKNIMNKNDVEHTYQDAFYLDVWCKDLSQHYPILSKINTPHPYQRFYYLWKLSYLHGVAHSNHNLSFEQLTEDPEKQIKELYDVLNISKNGISELCGVIQAPPKNQWQKYASNEWFEQHEEICENNLTLLLNGTPT